MTLDYRAINGGWGVSFLILYSLGLIHYSFPDQHSLKVFAAMPAIFVMFLSYSKNDAIIDFFAGGTFWESTKEISALTGDDHYYEPLDEKAQARLDRFDLHTYRKNNTIISAIILVSTAPIIGVLFFGLYGGTAGLIVSVLAYKFLFRDSVRELNQLAADIVEVYRAYYEGQ